MNAATEPQPPYQAPAAALRLAGRGRHRRRHRRRLGRWSVRQIVLVLVVVLLAPVGWSYARALTKPGTDGLGVRSVEWVRDHGGSRLVAWIETEWYSHHPPPKGGLPKTLPTAIPPVSIQAPERVFDQPSPVRLIAAAPLPGEGQWQPTGRTPDGAPVLYTTFMRPDAIHTSVVTGLAWMDTKRLQFQLWSGNSEPGGTNWSLQAPIGPALRPQLVAAFNSGFKLADSRGGYFAEGRMVKTLVPGKASMVFRADGTFEVGMWGRDFTLSSDVVAVRQNLLLLVDNGQPAPNLDKASEAAWGWTVANKVLVWRSGVGVDAQGHAIYAAGNFLSVQTLANVLVAAGAVRGMELDINSTWTHFYSYHDDPGVRTAGAKLIPDMTQSPDKYFHVSSRDFIAVFVRKPTHGAA